MTTLAFAGPSRSALPNSSRALTPSRMAPLWRALGWLMLHVALLSALPTTSRAAERPETAADTERPAVCPEAPAEALDTAVSEALEAFSALEEARFRLARTRVARLIPCTLVPITPAAALRVHVVRALASWSDGDLEAAARALRAVLAIEPDWRPAPELLPQDHPLYLLLAATAEDDLDPREVRLRAVPEAGWLVDGTLHTRPAASDTGVEPPGLPADRAFLLQLRDPGARGAPTIRYTGYHLSTVTVPPEQLSLFPSPEVLRKRRRRAIHGVGSAFAGALLVGSAVTLGLGLDQRGDILAGRVDPTEVGAVQERANLYGAFAAGFGVSGLILGTLTWSIPW
jgi:hypothetical protein